MPIEVALFDADGTLFNNGRQQYKTHCDVVRYYTRKKDLKLPSFEEGIPFLYHRGGYNAEPFYKRFGVKASRCKRRQTWERLYQNYIPEVTLYPGVRHTLETFHENGIRIGLISGSNKSCVDPLLKKFKMQHLFSYVYTGSVDKASKIQKIRCRERVENKEVIFVGDISNDIHQSNIAGVISVAFLNPTSKRFFQRFIKAEKPNYMIEKMSQLLPLIEKL